MSKFASRGKRPVVICNYCGCPAKLVDSKEVYGKSYGMIYLCKPCDAWVGVHKNTRDHVPLGLLANAELREWKKLAHAAFDPLWNTGNMSRSKAYRRLAETLGRKKIHIGQSDIEMCMKIIMAANDLRGQAVHPSIRAMGNFEDVEEKYAAIRQGLSVGDGLL
jgi:hypothetical protein